MDSKHYWWLIVHSVCPQCRGRVSDTLLVHNVQYSPLGPLCPASLRKSWVGMSHWPLRASKSYYRLFPRVGNYWCPLGLVCLWLDYNCQNLSGSLLGCPTWSADSVTCSRGTDSASLAKGFDCSYDYPYNYCYRCMVDRTASLGGSCPLDNCFAVDGAGIDCSCMVLIH